MNVNKGTVVRLKDHLLREEAGTIGVCYDRYVLGEYTGHAFIFQGGNFDGFSDEDITRFLDVIGQYPITYNFTNVMTLSRDYESKEFAPAFKYGLDLMASGVLNP